MSTAIEHEGMHVFAVKFFALDFICVNIGEAMQPIIADRIYIDRRYRTVVRFEEMPSSRMFTHDNTFIGIGIGILECTSATNKAVKLAQIAVTPIR